MIIGSEGRGASNDLRGIAQDVAIPTAGVESLNAAVAASVSVVAIAGAVAAAWRLLR